MQRLLFFADRLSAWVGKGFAWSIIVLIAVTVYDVTMRYAFNAPTGWAYDTEYILYGTLFLMAGPYALSRNGHVRGDVVYRLLPVRAQGAADFVLYLLFFFPAVLALLYSGVEFAQMSWMMREQSASSPDGPPIYPFKALIPLASFFLFVQGIAETLRAWIALRTGVWPERLHDVEELEARLLAERKAAADPQVVP